MAPDKLKLTALLRAQTTLWEICIIKQHNFKRIRKLKVPKEKNNNNTENQVQCE